MLLQNSKKCAIIYPDGAFFERQDEIVFFLTIITTFDPINGDLTEELYKKYHKQLYGIIISQVQCREDSEDILQQTFVRVWFNIKRFKDIDENQTIALLVKYAKNKIKDFYRKKSRRIETTSMTIEDDGELPKEFDIPDNTHNPEVIVLEKDSLEELALCVERLPDEQREVIELKYGNGMSNSEIAEMLEISIEAVNSKIYRAKQSLKKMKGSGEK